MIAPLPAHRATSAELHRVDPRIEAEVRAANLPRLMFVADLVRRELDASPQRRHHARQGVNEE